MKTQHLSKDTKMYSQNNDEDSFNKFILPQKFYLDATKMNFSFDFKGIHQI